MRLHTDLVRLLHVGFVLALMLGIVVRPTLVQMSELHADQHRSLAAFSAGADAVTDPASDPGHHEAVDPSEGGKPAQHHDDHGLHALMHVSWSGGAGHLAPALSYTPMNLSTAEPWCALPTAALAVRLPSPLRPPIV